MAGSSDLSVQSLNDAPKYPSLILVLFAALSFLYYVFLVRYWKSIENFLLVFENSRSVLMTYYAKIIDLFFYHPVFTDIALVIAFVSAIVYVILTLENRGHMVFSQDRKTIYEQNALAILFGLALFNAFLLLPYCYFLWVDVHRPWEAGLNILMLALCYVFLLLLSEFVKMMHNYKQLDEFCGEIWPKKFLWPISGRTNLAILINNKQQSRNLITLLIIVSIFSSYFLNLNLLTLAYIVGVLFIWMVIIFALTFPYGPVKGPVNIFLNTGCIFKRVFIIEESTSGYILILEKEGDKIVKIMTNAIAVIEPYSIPGSDYL
jgi:hypothetical protein